MPPEKQTQRQRFTYLGPAQLVAFAPGVAADGPANVPLHPGRQVLLDPADQHVKNLVELGHLAEAPDPDPDKPAPKLSKPQPIDPPAEAPPPAPAQGPPSEAPATEDPPPKPQGEAPPAEDPPATKRGAKK